MSKDTFSFKGWTTSDSFIKRSISIACYGAVGTLFLYILLALIFLLFLFMGFGVGWAFQALPKAKADLAKATPDLPKATVDLPKATEDLAKHTPAGSELSRAKLFF